MEDQTRSIADLIRAKLAARGLVPGREVLKVRYVAVARITLANGEGVEVVTGYLDNLGDDDDVESRMDLARLAVAEAEEHSGQG